MDRRKLTVTARLRLPVWNASYVNRFTVKGNGTLEVAANLDCEQDLPELVRFGMQLGLPRAMDRVAWYGRGPHESYWDRKLSAAVGLYENTVNGLHHVYGRPQENGNRTDVRWVRFTDENGNGLEAKGEPLIDFSAWQLHPGPTRAGEARLRALAAGFYHGEPRLAATRCGRSRFLGRAHVAPVHDSR